MAPRLEPRIAAASRRSEEHTSELQSLRHLVCRLLLEKKKRISCSGLSAASTGTTVDFEDTVHRDPAPTLPMRIVLDVNDTPATEETAVGPPSIRSEPS